MILIDRNQVYELILIKIKQRRLKKFFINFKEAVKEDSLEFDAQL